MTVYWSDFKVNVIFGYKELKQFDKFENGRMVSYGYSIAYDRDGRETSRTRPEALCSIGWDDGSPFTREDRAELKDGV